MRKLIRNKATKAFLMNGGEWTTDPEFAQQFRDAAAAYEAANHLHLTDAEFYYLIGETPSEHDITIPIISSLSPYAAPQCGAPAPLLSTSADRETPHQPRRNPPRSHPLSIRYS